MPSAQDIIELWKAIGWPLLAIIALGGIVFVLYKHGLGWITADAGLKGRLALLEQHVKDCNEGRLDDARRIGALEAELAEVSRRLAGLTQAFRKGMVRT